MTRLELTALMAASIVAGLRAQESNTDLSWTGHDEPAKYAVLDAEAILRVIDDRTPDSEKVKP